MKKSLLSLLALVVFGVTQTKAQILTDKFNYAAGSITDNSSGVWVNNTGTAQQLQVVSGNLSYAGYFVSGADGNMLALNTAGTEDIKTAFTAVNSGSVYYSFLMNISVTGSSAEYFAHFLSGSSQKARIFSKQDGTQFVLGIDGDGTTPTYATTKLDYGTTYLIVASYTFNPGTNDDKVSLWINPVLNNTPPAADVANVSVGSDYSNINGFGFRQAGSNKGITGNIDALRIAGSWSETPLPVTWTDFSAKNNNKSIDLSWTTSCEINNDKFEVLRSADGKSFSKIGKLKGAGNCTTIQNYNFNDASPLPGLNYYQIKQLDFDGKSTYSSLVVLRSNVSSTQLSVYSSTNNTSLNVQINTAQSGMAEFVIRDLNGKTITKQSLNLNKESLNLNLPFIVAKGIYIATLKVGTEQLICKFIH